MKKVKLLFAVVLVAAMMLSFAECNKQGEGEGSKTNVVKYYGETTERVLVDKIVVKFPTVFKVNDLWSDENGVTLYKEGADWELQINYFEYSADTYENYQALKEFYNMVYGNKVKKATLLGKEGIKADMGAALSIIVPIYETST